MSLDFVSAVLFLGGLIVLSNLKVVFESNMESFRNITVGLTVMALFSVISVLSQHNVFTQIPFLNEAMFFQLLYWIGMITGMILLLSGLSNWLPVYRKHLMYNSHELSKNKLFKKIEQLIRFENRNNVILLQTLELTVKHYGLTEASCFLYSQHEKKLSFLGAADSEDNEIIRSQLIHFDNSAITESISNNNLKLSYTTEHHTSTPDLMLPMLVNDKLIGLFCFYSDQVVDEKSVTNLKLVVDIITSKIHRDSKQLQIEELKNQEVWSSVIEKALDTTKTLKENMTTLREILQLKINVDFISITYNYQGKNPKLTVGDNNQVFEDLTSLLNDKNELEQYVLNTNTPMIISNLDAETDFIVDLTALQNNMKSIVGLPISNKQGQVGVIVVGSKKYSAYSKKDICYISQLNSSLERLITNSQNSLQEKTKLSRRQSLNKILRSLPTTPNPTLLYKKVTSVISTELNASVVRISFFDDDNRFLNSQVVSASEEFPFLTPEDATMMLSLMPNHRKVLSQRRTVRADDKLDTSDEYSTEQRQMFGDRLSQYFITPLFEGSLIVGVITVGYTDDEVTLHNEDISFVEDMATTLSVHKYIDKQYIKNKSLINQLQNIQIKESIEKNPRIALMTSHQMTQTMQGELVENN